MKAISICLFLLFLCCSSSYSQVSPYKEEYNMAQTRTWIITTLLKVVLWEHDSRKKPSYSFEDSSFIISIKSDKTIGGIPVTLGYVFPVNPHSSFMDPPLIMDVSSNSGEQFIGFAKPSGGATTYLNVNVELLPKDAKEKYVRQLNRAFNKLCGLGAYNFWK